ncbi:MAG: hypothetical protein HZA80_03205 [Candidatus Taylorbacteria bacterium]|nr:hypothetical protein [Candidatus Taylorbacteria bacterium]
MSKLQLEIERKFLLSKLPDVSAITAIPYERYFLERTKEVEVRIQRKGNIFTYQRKVEVPGIGRERSEDHEISEEEFNKLKITASKAILRTRYDLSPMIAIQVYHGDHEGLIRYEVEFPTSEDATKFQPEPWMGKEITDSPLGRDGKLLDLSPEQFTAELARYS